MHSAFHVHDIEHLYILLPMLHFNLFPLLINTPPPPIINKSPHYYYWGFWGWFLLAFPTM